MEIETIFLVIGYRHWIGEVIKWTGGVGANETFCELSSSSPSSTLKAHLSINNRGMLG